jgi:hypothetical protein
VSKGVFIGRFVAILSPSVSVSFSYGVLSAREINSTLFHDTKYKPKDKEQNRNKEGQMETTDTTEDDAEEVETEEIAEGKATGTDKPASQTPIEDEGGAGNDNDDGEAAKTTEEGFNVPTAEQVNNYVEGAATDSPIEKFDEPTVDVEVAYKIPKGGTGDTVNKEAVDNYSKNEVTERKHNESKEPVYKPPDDTSEFLDEMGANPRQTSEVEADTRTDEEEEDPHHAAFGPGAADDQPAPRNQHPSRDEELHHAAPGHGTDDQPALQDQQPGKITCKITQPATIPATVARLVPNPVGYNVNAPSHISQPMYNPAPAPGQSRTLPTRSSRLST